MPKREWRPRAHRALVALARYAARHSIETIVLVFVVTTLAYFQLVHAVSHSSLTATLSDQSLRVNAAEIDWSLVAPNSSASKSGTTAQDWSVIFGAKDQRESVDRFVAACEKLVPGIGGRALELNNNMVAWAVNGNASAHGSALESAMSSLDDGYALDVITSVNAQNVRVPINSTNRTGGHTVFETLRALAMRFENAIRRSDRLDFGVVLVAYVLMHGSFVSLYLSMRRFRSKFWLGTSVLVSSTFAFMIALAAMNLLGIYVDLVLLSEALPFLVITIGFEKPYLLTSAMFKFASARKAQNMSPKKVSIQEVSQRQTAEERFVAELTHRVQVEQSRRVDTALPSVSSAAVDAVGSVAGPIFRGYAVELVVLGAGIVSGVAGLREFCILSALTLAIDCMLLFSFYTAIVCIVLEVQRLRPSAPVCDALEDAPAEPHHARSRAHWLSRISQTLDSSENPLPRLKLFLLATVISLHSLNLLSMLTLSHGYKSHRSLAPFDVVMASSKAFSVAPGGQAVHPAASFVFLLNKNGTLPGAAFTAARIHYAATTWTSPISLADTDQPVESVSKGSLSALDSFLRAWTNIVTDKVFGKWISIVLVISVSLNAFLIKGIATRNRAVIDGNAVHVTAQAAARLVGGHLIEERDSPRAQTPSGPSAQDISAARAMHEAVPDDLAGGTITDEPTRPYEELLDMLSNSPSSLTDSEAVLLVQRGALPPYALEKKLGDMESAVRVRRAVMSRASSSKTLETSALPFRSYNYGQVFGACCENVVGYMPVPVGIAGPLKIDDELLPLPMATTEGTLVASTSRGCKALNACGGVTTVLTQDAMTRGPVVEFPSVVSAAKAKRWLDSPEGMDVIRTAFNSTSRFARLSTLRSVLAGRTLFVRFATSTGDAMGMNMISKGVEKALGMMKAEFFPDMQLLALSGNYCTDKKPAAINWIEGRGKSVVAEAVLKGDIVRSVLKCTVSDLARLNLKKNLVGSAMAGSTGGFNAHASNILTAIYIATGQDPAQNVESSTCITQMEPINDGADLLVTVSMPSIEVGTVGGGTILDPQGAMLDVLGVRGANQDTPGANSQRLARIIAAAVMAGELSLMAALAAGHLIQAHMKHNRSVPATPGTMTPGARDSPQVMSTFTRADPAPLIPPPNTMQP